MKRNKKTVTQELRVKKCNKMNEELLKKGSPIRYMAYTLIITGCSICGSTGTTYKQNYFPNRNGVIRRLNKIKTQKNFYKRISFRNPFNIDDLF